MPDFLFNLIKDLTPMQALLGLGAAILLGPTVWQYAVKLIKKAKNIPLPKPKPKVDPEDMFLTDLVDLWEELYRAVHAKGLHEACKKLEELFPLFLEKGKIPHDYSKPNSGQHTGKP